MEDKNITVISDQANEAKTPLYRKFNDKSWKAGNGIVS